MNNAIIIQECNSATAWTAPWSGVFYDMLRLTQPRHQSYARAHKFDLWSIFADVHPEMKVGAWPKVHLILDALKAGYEYVVWLDCDAAVIDFEADLRDALPADKCIGAVLHTPDKSAYLKQNNVPPHMNVGVLYVRNSELTREFFTDWLAAYPGHERWAEQGTFNELAQSEKYRGICANVADTYNATVNVNPVEKPVVMGWHGVMPPEKRLQMMRGAFADDFMKFRV